MPLSKRIKSIRSAEKKLAHRVWQGVKDMPALELSAFIIQNAVKGALEVSEHVEIKIVQDGIVVRRRMN